LKSAATGRWRGRLRGTGTGAVHARILIAGQRREEGWNDEPWLLSIPGFSMEIIIKFFQMTRIEAVDTDE
jgi:hypothetical protein